MTTRRPQSDDDVLPNVWRRPQPLGYGSGLAAFATVAAPLLAGFAFTSALALVWGPDLGTRGDVALVGFSAAAVLLLNAMQAGIQAIAWQVPISERLAYYPEALADRVWAARVRERQWRDEGVADIYRRRTRITFNAGIAFLFAALSSALIPVRGEWSLPRSLALAIVVVGLIVECIVLLPFGPKTVRDWLMPGSAALEKRPVPGMTAYTVPVMSAEMVRRVLADELVKPPPHREPEAET